jgi:hypothetical protein
VNADLPWLCAVDSAQTLVATVPRKHHLIYPPQWGVPNPSRRHISPQWGGRTQVGGREACTLRPAARVVVSIGLVESLPQSESVVA